MRLMTILLLLLASTVYGALNTQAVVRVEAGNSRGSGVYLGKNLVLTASHIYDGETTATRVIFNDGKSHDGVARTIDTVWDQAVVELTTVPNVQPVFVATANPNIGDPVYAAGFGPDGQLRVFPGVVRAYASPSPNVTSDWFSLTAGVRQGDSGGPVFNAQGELIGNLWGSSNGQTTALMAGRTKRFLLPWNAHLEALRQRTVCPPGQACPVPRLVPLPRRRPVYQAPSTSAPPTLVEPPPSIAPATSAPAASTEVQIDYDQLADKLMDRIRDDPSFVGPAGPPGLAGPPGPVGPEGPAGLSNLTVQFVDEYGNIASTQSISADGILRLPPVVIQIEHLDGTVKQQAKPLGVPITIKLVPISGNPRGN